MDTHDVAINDASHCVFCYEYIVPDEDDGSYGYAKDHAEGCLYIAARRLLGFPIE